MTEQRALFAESKGGPFAIRFRPIPTPGAGEVLIKIHSAALNPVDWKLWQYGLFLGGDFPAVFGTDIAGVVESVGESVESFQKGDRVLTQGYFTTDKAGFQQFTTAPVDIIAKIPEKLSFDEAATIPVAFSAAIMGLWAPTPSGAGLKPSFDAVPHYAGQAAVVLGGGSSAGQYAIQVLRLSGFSKIVAYASSKHADYLKTLGATDVIDRNATPLPELVTTIKSITGDLPVPIVYDAVGDKSLQQAGYDALSPTGHLITIVSDEIAEKTPGKEVTKVIASAHFPALRPFAQELYKHLEDLLAKRSIVPNRLEVLPGGLQGIIAGLERLKSGQVSGTKLVGHPQEE